MVVCYNPIDKEEQVLIRKHSVSSNCDYLMCMRGDVSTDETPLIAARRIISTLSGIVIEGELTLYYEAKRINVQVFSIAPTNWIAIRDAISLSDDYSDGSIGIYDLSSSDVNDLITTDKIYVHNLG